MFGKYLGRRYAFAKLDQRDPERLWRGEGLHLFAAASHERVRGSDREEGHVRSDMGADRPESTTVEPPQACERAQHGAGVARTAAEPGGDRDALLHTHVREGGAAIGLGESAHGPRGEIIAVGRSDVRCDANVERRFVDSDADAIAQVDRREDRSELVIAVRTATEHLERQVDLRRGHNDDGTAHARGTPAARASATHSSSASSSGLRSGAMPARASTAVARSRSIPASWPSAERSCLRRCLKASLTRRRKGSCASGANAGSVRVRRAMTADSTRGGGRKARAGTRRTIRGSAKDWTKTDRYPRSRPSRGVAQMRRATSS